MAAPRYYAAPRLMASAYFRPLETRPATGHALALIHIFSTPLHEHVSVCVCVCMTKSGYVGRIAYVRTCVRVCYLCGPVRAVRKNRRARYFVCVCQRRTSPQTGVFVKPVVSFAVRFKNVKESGATATDTGHFAMIVEVAAINCVAKSKEND